jgi:hypothetical protein
MMNLDKSKMYGLLDDPNTGQRLQRQVRVLKVGIGVPSGPDIHTWISPLDNQWVIEVGDYSGGKRQGKITKYGGKLEARTAYIQARKTAPERKYPRKVPYFTFLRMGADGNYVHDFDAIEQHGPTPTEIDIVFLDNDPLDSAFQMFTAAELKCEGNGLDARRRLSMAATPEEQELAAQAGARGEKFFPIINGCYARGCPYPREGKCKPHGRLLFQLLDRPRIGGACSFDTTSYRSIPQLSSGLEQIRTVTGRGNPDAGHVAGIPTKLVLRPYKVTHDGKTSTQYGVSLEVRASTAVELINTVMKHSEEYRDALQLTTSLPEDEAPDAVVDVDAQSGDVSMAFEESEEGIEAAALEAEFFSSEPPEENNWEDPVAMETGQQAPGEQQPKRTMPRRKSAAVAETEITEAPAPEQRPEA